MNALTAPRLSPTVQRCVVIAAVAIAILSLLLWFQGDFDRGLLLAHNPLRDQPALVLLFGALTRFGMSAICLLLIASVALSGRFPALREARPVLVVVLFSFAFAALSDTILKELLGRPRPIAALAGQLNVTNRHGSPSFPSGHAAKSVALALPFVFLVPAGSVVVRRVKLALLLLAGLVCYSRIALGAHYLSDVLAGVALALASFLVATAAGNLIFTRGQFTPEKLDMAVTKWMLVLVALTVGLPFL